MNTDQQQLMAKSNRSKRLLENEDYLKEIEGYRQIWARKVFALVDMPTTDPNIAEVQAEVRTLDLVVNGAKTSIKDYAELLKSLVMNQQASDGEDYSHG